MLRIGIDAGGSLIKLAYEEKGNLHVKTYSYNQKETLIQWLNMLAPEATLFGTGGKWPELAGKLKQKQQITDEFTSLVNGTKFLLETEGKSANEFILTSIGTGTSIFHVKENDFERILGSGIGGGTFIGLGTLLTKTNQFHEIVKLAQQGDRKKSDLLVKDIYDPFEAPLLDNLTAANFGKAHLNEEKAKADHAASLIQLIAEVILSLSGQIAHSKNIPYIVFAGSTLQGNKPLRESIVSFQDMLQFTAVFLEKGAYAGAIGALYA